jgi:hypothetical protein
MAAQDRLSSRVRCSCAVDLSKSARVGKVALGDRTSARPRRAVALGGPPRPPLDEPVGLVGRVAGYGAIVR